MLDEGTDHAMVVVAHLRGGQRVQGILKPQGGGGLIARQAAGHLSSSSGLAVAHHLVVRRR